MRRRLFNFACALSLVLCIAIGVMWARSGWCDERVQGYYNRWSGERDLHAYYFAVASYAGTISFRFNRSHMGEAFVQTFSSDEMKDLRQNYPAGRMRLQWVPADPIRYFLSEGPRPGFWTRHGSYSRLAGHREDDWSFAVRDWLPMLLLAILPGVWAWQWWRARRAKRMGFCAQCGYDLRASNERCPECGTAIRAIN